MDQISLQHGKLKDYSVYILTEILKIKAKLKEDLVKENNAILKNFHKVFITEMVEHDKLFKKLYQCTYYSGSFYSNLRISDPDEYDWNLILKLPFKAENISVEYQSQIPSYVKYRITNDSKITKESGLSQLFEDGFLKPDKVRSWIQSVADKAVKTCKLSLAQVKPGRSRGPARTIVLVKEDESKIDIDLVPVIECKLNTKPPGIDHRVCTKISRNLQGKKGTQQQRPKSNQQAGHLVYKETFNEQWNKAPQWRWRWKFYPMSNKLDSQSAAKTSNEQRNNLPRKRRQQKRSRFYPKSNQLNKMSPQSAVEETSSHLRKQFHPDSNKLADQLVAEESSIEQQNNALHRRRRQRRKRFYPKPNQQSDQSVTKESSNEQQNNVPRRRRRRKKRQFQPNSNQLKGQLAAGETTGWLTCLGSSRPNSNQLADQLVDKESSNKQQNNAPCRQRRRQFHPKSNQQADQLVTKELCNKQRNKASWWQRRQRFHHKSKQLKGQLVAEEISSQQSNSAPWQQRPFCFRSNHTAGQPAAKKTSSRWFNNITHQRVRRHFPDICFLVPKPYEPLQQSPINNTEHAFLWRAHYPKAEEFVIYNLGCAKNVIRLLKLLRNKENWKILASYYLKTIVMWMIIENPCKESWKMDHLGEKFVEALRYLKSCVEKRRIPYFFSSGYNLLEKLSKEQANDIQNRLYKIIREIESDDEKLWYIF